METPKQCFESELVLDSFRLSLEGAEGSVGDKIMLPGRTKNVTNVTPSPFGTVFDVAALLVAENSDK